MVEFSDYVCLFSNYSMRILYWTIFTIYIANLASLKISTKSITR